MSVQPQNKLENGLMIIVGAIKIQTKSVLRVADNMTGQGALTVCGFWQPKGKLQRLVQPGFTSSFIFSVSTWLRTCLSTCHNQLFCWVPGVLNRASDPRPSKS